MTNQVVNYYLNSGLGAAPRRTWQNPDTAPGNDIAKLLDIRVRSEQNNITDTIDIRNQIRIDMEFLVLKEGYVLVPNLHFYNEEGTCIFIASDHDLDWKRVERPCGRFVSTATIPGNFFSEGMVFVSAAVSTMNPEKIHFFERDVVAFNIVDNMEGDSARGDYIGNMPGIVRPY